MVENTFIEEAIENDLGCSTGITSNRYSNGILALV
jgi:hypothetical protein